ncbi:unnamed protein product, partial [Ectocarpus sp. 12 AP-2014]
PAPAAAPPTSRERRPRRRPAGYARRATPPRARPRARCRSRHPEGPGACCAADSCPPLRPSRSARRRRHRHPVRRRTRAPSRGALGRSGRGSSGRRSCRRVSPRPPPRLLASRCQHHDVSPR